MLRTPRRARREAGIALVLTAVIGFLTLGLFAVAIRSGHDSIRGERLQWRRAERAVSITASLADGVSLLRTGEPPIDPFACIATQTDDDGVDWDVKVTFTKLTTLQYDLDAALASEAELLSLPAMPLTF
ncbi:MAG: hypothetical protein DRQ55_01950 [Planctomycetota bacterium]|nr:MAG: hypothetical protein DRQ55_01950 [Planctomycetota bacterium]